MLLVFRGIVQLVERRSPKPDVVGSSPTTPVSDFLAQWFSRLERRPVTAEVRGSSPLWVVNKKFFLLIPEFFKGA